uniref:NADH-ubiquinone oxidoreductase chain 6 n=1 Tax=Thalassina kelanang TaxID=1114971 RepID=K4EYC3_THAKE|nr:NADH dehydrogenase subunit 6 [Thalassina kelanang]AEW68307.1 NADH dehydrogenase subunit 6 [Thalassina kelanang]
MLTMTIPTIILLSLLFTRLQHPLSMGLILLMQTILISVSSGILNPSFWMSYILFLIFLGGMLVLFIYVASLASNELFKFSFFLASIFIVCLLFSILMFLMTDKTLITNKISSMMPLEPTSFLKNSYDPLTSPIYHPPTSALTIFIVLYLLLTLFVVVKITNNFFGPLRIS